MKPIAEQIQIVAAPELAAVRAAYSALREADAQLEKLERKTTAARETQNRRRLELGRALVEARSNWPTRGPHAKGWGDFLEAEGIPQRTAYDLMALAGYVEDISATDENVAEIPTHREVVEARRERTQREREEQPDDPADEASAVEIISPGSAIDLRLGDWRTVLLDVGMVDAIITDPPYGARTHAAVTTRDDNSIPTGLTPTYDAWTALDIESFVAEWSSRCRGWMVALTDSELIQAWRSAFEAHDRYAFSPVPCVITGMSVRLQGDGPSSWAVYAMVSRPRNLSKWGTLPGAYIGPREEGAKSGRGKPSWLMDAIVGDYTRGGDLVCDPLAGYGVTLTSAIKLGRRAVGAEIDNDARREAIQRWHAQRAKTPVEAA